MLVLQPHANLKQLYLSAGQMMFLSNRLFRLWLLVAMLVWIYLFVQYSSVSFLIQNWFYPAIMVIGAFVAGVTPEGGGVVAFPMLNIFIGIERTVARDFSLMVQSIGMTSASIYILTRGGPGMAVYRTIPWMLVPAFAGFALGMMTLQSLPVHIIQALFLSLIVTFTLIYYLSDHRGAAREIRSFTLQDRLMTGLVCTAGGMCSSLFGTGADIFIYTLLVTRFRMQEQLATKMSIMLMAGISVFGFGWRHFVDGNLTTHQVQTWLTAFPVVLFMAPLGSYVLERINREWLLRFICVVNIGQLIYFNLYRPSMAKLAWSLFFTVLLGTMFYWLMRRLVNLRKLDDLLHRRPKPDAESIKQPGS